MVEHFEGGTKTVVQQFLTREAAAKWIVYMEEAEKVAWEAGEEDLEEWIAASQRSGHSV